MPLEFPQLFRVLLNSASHMHRNLIMLVCKKPFVKLNQQLGHPLYDQNLVASPYFRRVITTGPDNNQGGETDRPRPPDQY